LEKNPAKTLKDWLIYVSKTSGIPDELLLEFLDEHSSERATLYRAHLEEEAWSQAYKWVQSVEQSEA